LKDGIGIKFEHTVTKRSMKKYTAK